MTVVAARRPTLVTVVGVLVILSGILDLLLGLVWLFYEPDGDKSNTLGAWIGIALLVVGAVQVILARGLFRGDSRSRAVVGFAIGLDIVIGLISLTAGKNPRGLSISDLVFAVFVVAILYSPKANAFFARR
jgi:drug/metabolite transporter (DMT)-like permease